MQTQHCKPSKQSTPEWLKWKQSWQDMVDNHQLNHQFCCIKRLTRKTVARWSKRTERLIVGWVNHLLDYLPQETGETGASHTLARGDSSSANRNNATNHGFQHITYHSTYLHLPPPLPSIHLRYDLTPTVTLCSLIIAAQHASPTVAVISVTDQDPCNLAFQALVNP